MRIAEQVAQRIDTMRIANGRQEVTVHLRPDHLGDIRMTIVADRQEVSAAIVADTAAARDAVHEGREHLRAALEQKGFTLQGLDVSLGGSAQQGFTPFGQAQQQPAAFRPGITSPRPMDPEPVAIVAGRETTHDGRLDYQA